MARKISIVINSFNNEEIIKRAILSVKWADEIVVCDMHSDDKTVEVAKKLGARVVFFKRTNYVEPARNFAISQTSGDWVLVLDTDEEIPSSLAEELKRIAVEGKVDFVEIPRKNIIFGKYMKASKWWPDYNIRFFKSGSATWSGRIHIPPKTSGEGYKLPAEEKLAIAHYNYTNLSQFIARMNGYTTIQAQLLQDDGYKFFWKDLISKPLGEFLSRFFANRGFEDGLHGLALSLLQAFSFLVMYLKVWEMEKFKEEDLSLGDIIKESKKAGEEIDYWFKYGNLSKNPLIRSLQRIINKF